MVLLRLSVLRPVRPALRHIALAAACALVAALAGCGRTATGGAAPGRASNYAALATRAAAVLAHGYYAGAGLWHMCVPSRCDTKNFDWGADSLTYALYLDWQLTGDQKAPPIMAALAGTAVSYGTAGGWSDVPMWDAIADVREYQVTGDPAALAKARAAFAVVDSAGPGVFAVGHCPAIDYQQPGGGANHLKTLETDSNYVKAALLLYQATGDPAYLAKAERKYQAARAYFLDPRRPLYSVYVFDTGSRCSQLPGQYFASVNGNMIWAGAELAGLTGDHAYLDQAVATARAASADLADATGVFADLQAENDVVEPLAEAMYLLATADHEPFARAWLVRSASAAAAARTALGSYGRFFDGPPPLAPVTSWQVNGAIAVMIAAARLDPRGTPADPGYWQRARFAADDKRLAGGSSAPVRVVFSGRAIAIIGTLGEVCCEAGHARFYVDGKPTVDGVGIWQDKSSSGRRLPDSVLFAWRWPTPGTHTITIAPAPFNPKQGGTFFHMTGYYLVG